MHGKFRVLAAAAIVAALAGGTAAAQDATRDDAPRVPKSFRVLDTNNDGKVTLDEIEAEQARLLGAADLDNDGSLSVEEFRRRGRWFQRLQTTTLFDLMDANGDQVLTAEEIAAPSARWFKRYDKDADGSIVADEVPHLNRGKGRYHGR